MGLTPSQQNAVDVRDRTLLVSAAAGSGKTYTLTQRIIKSIIEDGQDLSRLLIVTFTRAAAGELKAKISKALGVAIAEHPENIHLQKQLIKLGSAHISTIDSFFTEPIRQNFEKLGLPAGLRLSDEAELSPVREKILSETLEEFFENCGYYKNANLAPVGYSDRYTELMGIITGARDSSSVLPTFIDLYKKLITSPEGFEQLKKHSLRLKDSSNGEFFDSLEGQAIKDEIYSTVKYVWKTLIKCSEDMQSDAITASAYTADFVDNAALCHTLLTTIERGGYDEVKAAFEAYEPAKITTIKATDKTETSEYYKKLRTSLNKSVKDIPKTILYKNHDELSTLLLSYSDMCALLYEILTVFDRKYAEEKKRRGVCEFSDMPKFLLALLLDQDGNPTEYAKNLADSFDEVYIDEYQDVNEIQDRIFEIIGGSHRFMVGDIKQSIYGFREAEPSIFAGYRKKFTLYDKDNDVMPEGENNGSTIFMSENFRCDENVIAFTNAVCAEIFSAFADNIGYTSADDLRFGKGRPYEGYSSPKVSLNIIQKPDEDDEDDDGESGTYENPDKFYDEATLTANEIIELLKNGQNADGSPITAGQIAILVRYNTSLPPIIKALNAANIKYILSSKGELFETEDMKILVDLLSVIDNPRDDLPLCHLLTAQNEIYTPELSLEDIIKIRQAADKSSSLYDDMLSYSLSHSDDIASKCQSFISYIEKMRDAATKTGADKLIKSLISSEKYNALTKTAAFTYLYDSACKYVKTNWSSLYSFINYFKDVMEKGESGSEPDSSVQDAVRVMTVHQSKGLEFNVCFLFGFGRNFNLQNRTQIIFNKGFGASMKLPPKNFDNAIEKISVRYEDNPIFKAVDRANKTSQIEEEARIFYVALTRARERLYISATLSKSYEKFTEKLKACADISYEVKKSNSYIKWILLALAKDKLAADVFDLNIYDKGSIRPSKPLPRYSAVSSTRAANDEEKHYAKLLSSPLAKDENAAILDSIPSKVAASKITPHMLDDSVFIPVPTGKLFSENNEDVDSAAADNAKRIQARIDLLRSSPESFDSLLEINKKPTAAEIGTATHAFLQFCDYENVEKNGVDAEISRLLDGKFISKRTSEIIDTPKIERFFKNQLYDYIKSAKNVRREFHFGMFRDASDFTESKELKTLVAGRKIYVQGSVDLIIETHDGEIILCDYKTDRVSAEERRDRALLETNMKEKHGEQLKQYAFAVEKIFGKAPSKIFIYSLSSGDSIAIQ